MTAGSDASRREILKVVGVGVSGVAFAGALTARAVMDGDPSGASAGGGSTLPEASAVDPAVVADPAPVEAEAAALAAVHPREREAAARTARELHGYLGDLLGARLGVYTVVAVGALDRGGIPVTLATASGTTFRADILRVDPTDGPTGIGIAGRVSVYLRNGGKGHTATDEEQGLGAMALAEELLRRERVGLTPPAALLTRGERESLDSSRVA